MSLPAFLSKAITNYFRFIAGGVAVLLVAGGYLLILGPKITDVQSSQVAARKNAEADLKAKQEYVSALRESNAKFTTVLPTESRERINTFIPTGSDFPSLLLTVNNIVTQAQLTLDSINVGQGGQIAVAGQSTDTNTATGGTSPTARAATIGGVNLRTEDVTITISGGTSYDAFKQVLNLFESSQRLFDVVSVTYAAAKTEESKVTGTANWSLVLRTYYLPKS